MKTVSLGGHYGKGKVAIVSDADFVSVSKHRWHVSNEGYVVRSVGQSKEHLANFILGRKATPDKTILPDHRNGNRLDNRRRNLRVATSSQNSANRKLSSTNRSGFKGVFWVARLRKWKAAIWDDGQKTLGFFQKPIQAARVYDKAARKLFGEFAKTNFPKPRRIE